jgi:oligoendopeptidase F
MDLSQRRPLTMQKELKERKDVDVTLTWDLTALFRTEEEYNDAVDEITELTGQLEKEYKGKLGASANINSCLDKLRKIRQLIDLAGSYANLAVETDQSNARNQERFMKFIKPPLMNLITTGPGSK